MTLPSTKLRYAILEDAEDVCRGLKERMDDHPNWQHCGTSAEIDDAIALIEGEQPCLIFMDWNLKGGSTYPLLDLIQSKKNYKPYIVFFTAFQGEHPSIPVKANNQYKVDKYLTKPFFADFTENLESYLSEAIIKHNTQSDVSFIKDAEGKIHPIRYRDLAHINRHIVNNRVKVLTFTNGQKIGVRATFEEIEELLKAQQIDYFFTNKRYSIVCRQHIISYDHLFVYFAKGIPKVDIVSERFKDFEDWFQNR